MFFFLVFTMLLYDFPSVSTVSLLVDVSDTVGLSSHSAFFQG